MAALDLQTALDDLRRGLFHWREISDHALGDWLADPAHVKRL